MMLKSCAICCILLSGWAMIQLPFMALFFKMEAVLLIEDAGAHEYEDMNDFLEKTKNNYSAIGTNCLVASGVYVVFFALSFVCLNQANKKEKKRLALLADDDAALEQALEVPQLSEKEKKKIK